jgi:hypothetical protein
LVDARVREYQIKTPRVREASSEIDHNRDIELPISRAPRSSTKFGPFADYLPC